MPRDRTKPMSHQEYLETMEKMDYMGVKGYYNPKNIYPGSPFTPSSEPSPAEVRKQAKIGSERVLSDWHTLRKIVEKHSVVLEKRWVKKTRKKQKDLLLQAWPNMSPSHRPDFEAYRKENTGRHWTGLSKFQEAYKWPHINLHDLSTRSLMIFINSRARNPPSAFARADIDATRLGTIGHWIEEPAFLMKHTLFMDGETSETYGKLVSWDDDEESALLMFSQRQFTPGDGLRVLELQEKVYPFLVKCCELILHDLVESGSMYDDQFPIVQADAAASQTESSTIMDILPSLASISAEAPYRLPANLNLDRLSGIFAARLSAAEDHLWQMREDPGYFSDTIIDWSEHRNDRLLDTMGNPHPTGPHTTDFWERVIRNAVADAYTGFETWSLLHRQVNRMLTLKEKYKDKISYDNQLPEEYLVEILKFEQLLLISCEEPLHIGVTTKPMDPWVPDPWAYGDPWGLAGGGGGRKVGVGRVKDPRA
ncbi:hypothetical protein LOCC1_G003492 [Lachnellula occidentalis]|uniref:Uncharacterized protein n=1 Tax=Lachnellula occidentalis TaxID=215460 RepID=A0A8H8UHR1_9HELO|nr:hypothetical protein LOCC1_G003492 [Lachnellula occidentalis]